VQSMPYLNSLLSKPRVRFCLQATVSVLLAFSLAHMCAIPLHDAWTIPTAVAVIQMSIGGSLKAAAEYIIGTIGGAVYAGAIAAFVPHSTDISLAVALAITIAPLAYAAAVSPSFRVAPVTAVLVLTISTQLGETPMELAFGRLLEVAIGGVVAVIVSLLVFPAPAHTLGLNAAGRVLEHMARALPAVILRLQTKFSPHENLALQDEMGEAVNAFAAVAAEAKRERLANLAPDPDLAMLARTLLRLRHDLVMLGRAASAPLPHTLAPHLGPLLVQVGANARDYLLGSAKALTSRTAGPSPELVDGALTAYATEVASVRIERLLEGLSACERERIFALGFVLQQMQHNFLDLAACLREWTRQSDGARLWLWQCDLERVALCFTWAPSLLRNHLRRAYQTGLRGGHS
jgi:uncharacterized membrane protein YccC